MMRRPLGFFLAISLGMLLVLFAPLLRDAASELGLFEVREVSVLGAESLTHADVVAAARIQPGASIWDDLGSTALRVAAHPLVRAAEVRRQLPDRLIVEIQEREPVAFLPTPTLTPVDVEAQPLPMGAAGHRLDLPLVQPRRDAPGEAAELTPAQLRRLTSELSWIAEVDPSIHASVSEISLDSWGDVLLHLDSPRVVVRYRAPLAPVRLDEGLRVLADALERAPERTVVSVDLRFAGQVVVRYADSPPS